MLMSMYGTRDAALNWHEEYSIKLMAAGYVRGVANPCLFRHKGDNMSVMVHGDDFVAVGPKDATAKLQKTLESAYNIKRETMGDGEGEVRDIRVLNRIVRRESDGYRVEADLRHAELVIKELNLTGTQSSKLPGSKEEKKKAGGGPAVKEEQRPLKERRGSVGTDIGAMDSDEDLSSWYRSTTGRGKGRGGDDAGAPLLVVERQLLRKLRALTWNRYSPARQSDSAE